MQAFVFRVSGNLVEKAVEVIASSREQVKRQSGDQVLGTAELGTACALTGNANIHYISESSFLQPLQTGDGG